jgi:uncharacterized membrane protein YbhN (UPF0104 family)
MLTPDQAVSDFALPALDARALVRRARLPVLLAAAAVAVALLAGGPIRAFAAALHRVLELSPGWVALGVVFECVSVAGYVGLLSLVAGRATRRIGIRESAQITLTGAAATRLLPTAGAGGAAVTLWALRRAGLTARASARTLLAFLVVLYSVFLVSIVLSGSALTIGVVDSRAPIALSAVPSVAAVLGIALCIALSYRRRGEVEKDPYAGAGSRKRVARLRDAAELIGHAVRDALGLVRSRESRLAGAVAYWVFDAAVLWAMLHAFGSRPSVPVVALAYLIGQVANTLPLPGTVSGGMAGMLIAFGGPAEVALPSVLAYRTVAVWLPSTLATAAIPGLRNTIGRWTTEDGTAPVTASGASD